MTSTERKLSRFILLYPLVVSITNLKDVNIIDIRRCKYTEIDIIDDPQKVISILGQPIKIIRIGEIKESFQELFFNCRFWEAHEVLEGIWRKETDEKKKKYLQGLILLCASMIHYLKGHEEVSDELIGKALSLISELPEDILPLLYINVSFNS
ncbi:DUF309 domain-containing protein [Acidianus sp. HS-5]|uniref:DUF309 domain-containing protein n=1 Tax=Acidianus sp. HS-5 TaxID=2886040 RepID=UPI001F310AC7|nr:DUF309 domain-containing protein [Acidianus sp. HS-5]BDC19602.1 hypothetical protein HS5_24920 [Acidianus sp. HS-5]